ncbi:DeoR family transcriptional regulator [Prauserella marina]|uniref:DNA-binding transcriptional regulator of sugar metabolism, DeoR/GlpR family n=1 Tax=Prauserella marina TaxID=530584 RepID=A0A222VJT1_9PSEU|nr:DeoR/GlpR family DNA-binding transcription regulator [Prauserella marina]ASR34134.1 DeoR family transcriptional regulator [Prauserella marina]PWV82779.1 DeoR family transcriptional regulator [Prauserella marina]SDC77057.1 DNA-binding transcriptional regulator of sugar metabolism, DeoR/GlpR family [Prauserella marina]
MPRTRQPDAAVERRRQAILRAVIEAGEIRIDDLTSRFSVSLMTMHRDLDDLADRRLLRKFRGRAAAYPALTMETAKRFREGLHLPYKEALCAMAITEVAEAQTVFLDDSTTLFPLARRLAERDGITVVTNSLEIARIVGEDGRGEVVVLGGRYTEFDSCVGADALSALRRIRADVGFVSATAVAASRLYHPVRDYADLKEAVVAAANRNVLVVDHSKFGRTATYAYGDVSAYDVVITDDQVPSAEIESLRAAGTRVVLASAGIEQESSGI